MPSASDEKELDLIAEGINEGGNQDQLNAFAQTPKDSSTLFNSASMPLPGDPGVRVRVQVLAPYRAAELSIVDRTYALVAVGVGRLEMMLPAGNYLVRQRVGDEENIEPLIVSPNGESQTVTLPFLQFPSPIPLQGTTLVDSAGSDLQQVASAQGNFRLLIWAPTEGVKDSEIATTKERIATELSCLRLEVFHADGPSARKFVPFSDVIWTECGNALIAMELELGCYVLVQRDDSGRQRCMPIWLLPRLVTSVFLLSLQAEEIRVPLRLDHAGVAFLKPEDFQKDYEASFYQLEVARKAMQSGRQVDGWSCHLLGVRSLFAVNNPLLHLMDAMLLLSTLTNKGDWLTLNVGYEVEGFGKDFPDSIALRMSIKRIVNVDTESEQETFDIAGPPLLRRSWDFLLHIPNGSTALSRVMNFSYTVDSTGTWFLWSEELSTPQVSLSSSQVSTGVESAMDSLLPLLSASALGGTLITSVMRVRALFARKVNKMLLGSELAPVSYENVVNLLITLTENGMLENYLEKGQMLAAEKGIRVDDEALQRLVQSLEVLSDKTLVKALTAEILVREALDNLRLPKAKIISLVRSALTEVLAKVDLDDKAVLLKAMSKVIDKAEQWLVS